MIVPARSDLTAHSCSMRKNWWKMIASFIFDSPPALRKFKFPFVAYSVGALDVIIYFYAPENKKMCTPNYNFVTIIWLVGHWQACSVSNSVWVGMLWEAVGVWKGAQWGKGFLMDRRGERENIKVCKETDTMRTYMNYGKSQDTDVKVNIWSITILIVSFCAIVPPYSVHICLKWQIGDTWAVIFEAELFVTFLSHSHHSMPPLLD